MVFSECVHTHLMLHSYIMFLSPANQSCVSNMERCCKFAVLLLLFSVSWMPSSARRGTEEDRAVQHVAFLGALRGEKGNI